MATGCQTQPLEGTIVQKKLILDEVLECAACRDQIASFPLTLRNCLHSLCDTCLTNLPRVEQNGQKGWKCPECKTFSNETTLRQNDFIEDLKTISSQSMQILVEACQQCNSSMNVTKKCEECKTALCQDCQAVHLKIPMLKDHTLLDIDQKNVMQPVDKLVYCRHHPAKLIKYNCKTCNCETCSVCNLTTHNTHQIETVEEAIDRLMPDVKKNAQNINKNLYKIQKQIEAASTKIEETKDSYKQTRKELDLATECLVCHLKMMRQRVEEELKQKETDSINELQAMKKKLKFEQSKLRNISRLSKVTTENARHSSLLNELQSGLLDNLRQLGHQKKSDENFEIQLPCFHPGDYVIEEEWPYLVGRTTFGTNLGIIDTAGVKWTDNRYLCEDLSYFSDKKMDKGESVKVSSLWCNGFSFINKCMWVGFPSNNKLMVYSCQGDVVSTIETNKVTAIREAGNGDLIACGFYGLFVTNMDCSKWTRICGGKYSDLYVHGKKFSALQYDNPKVVTYELTVNHDMNNTHWSLVSSFDLPEQYFGQHDSMNKIMVDKSNSIMVSKCGNKKAIFMFTEFGALQYIQDTKNWEPLLCGMDKSGRILVANYQQGKLYVVDSINDLGPGGNMTDFEVHIKGDELLDAIVDHDSNLWTLQGNKDRYALVKYNCANKIAASSLKELFTSHMSTKIV